MEAPFPKMSGLVRTHGLISKAIIFPPGFRAPWNCRSIETQTRGTHTHTVGFHNFNLRVFNLRVSNPNKLMVGVFFYTMSDFNVPGSRPPKTMKFRKSTVHDLSNAGFLQAWRTLWRIPVILDTINSA